MLHILTITTFLTTLHLLLGEVSSEACPCLNPLATASWGVFRSTGSCEGCPGLEPGTRDCYANINGLVVPVKIVCEVSRPCPNCLGTWSQWSNIGICPESCEQIQARYCYRVSFILRLLTWCLKLVKQIK